MSETRAIYFCTRQLVIRGNWRPWRFLLKRWVHGLLAWDHCAQCGKRKKVSLHQNCYSCRFENIKKALFEDDEAQRAAQGQEKEK
jgi:hypothetical protein